MITKEPLKVYRTLSVFAIFFAILVMGCGGDNTDPYQTHSARSTPVYSPTRRAVSSPTKSVKTISLPPSTIPILSTTLDGLRFDGKYSCNFVPYEGLPTNIVLTQLDPLNYDSKTLLDIKQSLASVLSTNSPQANMPTSLQFVLGGGCSAYWSITNTGTSAVELSGIGFQLTQPPQQNNYHYQLIGICEVFGERCGAEGGPQLSVTINLTNANAGTNFTGKFEDPMNVSPIKVNPANASLILIPNSAVGVVIEYQSSANPNNLIYVGYPELLLDTTSGVQPIQLPQVTLVFANQSQSSCFSLLSDKFVNGLNTDECI